MKTFLNMFCCNVRKVSVVFFEIIKSASCRPTDIGKEFSFEMFARKYLLFGIEREDEGVSFCMVPRYRNRKHPRTTCVNGLQ